MSRDKVSLKMDVDTQTKIKNAARLMFHRKGFAATRTRDIAEEAGINLALLNYYFRSKQKLFDIIMMETMQSFFQAMAVVLNDEQSTFKEKITAIANNYIDLLSVEPEIPLFLMNAVRSNPNVIFEKLPIKQFFLNSVFIKQFDEMVSKGKIVHNDPLQFVVNMLGLIVFPFIARPMVKEVGGLSDIQFDKMMYERRRLIPLWIKFILKTK